MREEDHECMVFAYRKILQSHGDNLKLANIDPRICSPAALEKEIFRIFADCMKWIKRIRTTAEQNIKRIAAYQIMSVFFFSPLDDHLSFTLNCFCRITEANHMVYTCLSDNPDPHDALGDRENHAKIHYTAACHACDNASYITERHFRPIDIPSMTACYHNATLKRRHRDSVGLWFQTLDHTLKKIDHDLSEDKESLESYDESVEWWYNRLRKALKEGREEQDAANLLMSLKSSRDRFHRHFPSHP